jgi:alpha-2-macroglobulin
MDSPDVFMTPLSYATHPLTILPVNRKIQVSLTAPKEVRPGKTLTINYSTAKPTRIIVYAVDEGIHQITRYKRPEPLDFFFRKQALEVRTQQWLDLLLPEYRFLKQNSAFGGDGGDELDALSLSLNPFKRKRDAPVVWWSGIQTADSSVRELSYQVPDYFSGNLTIMAVAVSEMRAGSAQTSTLVRAPLVLTPNTPTSITPGDEFVVSVTVTNLIEAPNPAEISLRIETSNHLQVMGDAVATVTCETSREVTQRFRVKALDVLGSASIKFHAMSGSETALRTETISVRPASTFRTQVRSAYVRTKTHEQAVSRSMYDAYRRNEVVASPLPVVLALGMRDYMQSYAYDCTEQITSKGLTLLSYRAMKDLPQDALAASQTINGVIAQLQSRQSNSGGFGYWQGSTSESDDFLNVYVMHFLLEAKDAGFAIPHQLLERGNAKLKAICSSGEITNLAMADRKAYAIYLLTRQGQRPNALLSLRDSLNRTKEGTWQTRFCGSLLAATYLLQQNSKEVEAIVKTWKLANAEEYSSAKDLWSNVEVDRLLSFAIRSRHFPNAVKDYGYADWQKLYGVLWQESYNTITAACATLGMSEFSKVVKGNGFRFEIDAQPRDGSPPISLVKSDAIFAQASFADATKAINFRLQQNDGDQGLFYQVVEEGFDRALPSKPQKDGIEVYREFSTMDGKPIESLLVGDSLKVTLRVRNISAIPLGNLAMTDLLPGGFSLEPNGLKPGVNTVPGTERVDLREDRNVFFFTLQGAKDLTIEYVLRATCAGDFVVPPLYAESMYDRGINGVGMGRRISVTSRE